jgi:glucuronate isomerase
LSSGHSPAIYQDKLPSTQAGDTVSLQDLGSIGELIAAIATVATLVYLAIQIRHNSLALDRSNEFAQAGSIHDITLLFNELNWRLASDGELADIYTRALAGENLTSTEATRFVAFVNTYVATIENLVGQQTLELGYTELDSSSALTLFGPILKQLLETKEGAKWWQETARHLYIEEFRSQVDAAIARAGVRLEELGTGE